MTDFSRFVQTAGIGVTAISSLPYDINLDARREQLEKKRITGVDSLFSISILKTDLVRLSGQNCKSVKKNSVSLNSQKKILL